MRQLHPLQRNSAQAPSTIVHAEQRDPRSPDTSKPHRPGAAPPRPGGISRDPAARRQVLEAHARNASPATVPSSDPAPASVTEATPRPSSRTSRLLRTLVAGTKRYFAHWRHASTDERGEAIVIVPPRDPRSRTQD